LCSRDTCLFVSALGLRGAGGQKVRVSGPTLGRFPGFQGSYTLTV
jgi:hypothetical protein